MLKRLKRTFGKRADDDTTGQNKTRVEKHGLSLITRGPATTSCAEDQYPVDIVAVHGLNGDVSHTWTHSNGTMWIRDFLPGLLPGCRVYTYGYPAKLFFNPSLARVQEYSRGLLNAVQTIHEEANATRSIIFLCHSLGGIVCKQALVFAHEDDVLYGPLLRSITGVIFLGTPHRGSDTATLAALLTSIGFNNPVVKLKTSDLKYLKYDSPPLQDLTLSARNRLENLDIVSFYETEPTPPSRNLIVNRTSAVLGIPREEVIPLYETHRSMCRFPGQNASYRAVSVAIRRVAAKSLVVGQQTKPESTHSSLLTFDDLEKTCIALFSGFDIRDYKCLLPKPVEGTWQWVLHNPLFLSWRERADNGLLWLTGHPGCGKTILSLSLAQYLETSGTTGQPLTVLVYFCDEKVARQRDARSVVIGLILQLIHQHRSLIRYVRKVYELQGPTLIQSFPSLWNLLLRIIKDPRVGSICIILDALDECEKTTCHELLDSISKLVASPHLTTSSGSHVKVLVTSRPHLSEQFGHCQPSTSWISIDEHQPGYSDGLRTFVEYRVKEMSRKRSWTSEMAEYLLQTLCAKANQTFLWVHTVFSALEKSLLSSIPDLRTIISSIPPDLEEMYTSFISKIPPDDREAALRLLRLLLASTRPLQLDEINVAFTIHASHESSEDVTRDRQTKMGYTLQGLLDPFIRITESTVSLVHQSVKDFLQRNDRSHNLPAIATITTEDSAREMATACMNYLLLEDFSRDIFTPDSGPESASEPPGSGSGSPASSVFGGLWNEEGVLDASWLFNEPGVVAKDTCEVISSRYTFYEYASQNWARHFASCEKSAPPELQEAARDLLDVNNTASNNWLKFYSADPFTPMDGIPEEPSPILLAANFGMRETLLGIMKSQDLDKASLNQALFFASRGGHSSVVATLLEAGADANLRGHDLQTPLTVAAEYGHQDCVATLLDDNRTDPNVRGRKGRTALSFACGNGHAHIVNQLLKRVGTAGGEADDSGATPLFWAVGGEHLPIITAMTKHPWVDLNHRDKTGRTAVSWAAGDNTTAALKKLLGLRRIDINLADNLGKSPLSWAAGNGCDVAVEILLESKKVDKGSVDRNGRGAISWACAGGHLAAIEKLIKHKCPGVDDEDVDNWTPLAWAVQQDAPKVIEALLKTGQVDIHRGDASGRTILYWAVGYGHVPVVEALLRNGADPEAPSSTGMTPIQYAASFDARGDVLEVLLKFKKPADSGSTAKSNLESEHHVLDEKSEKDQ